MSGASGMILAGLRVPTALERTRGLLLGLVEQLVLEVLGQEELLDDEVAGVHDPSGRGRSAPRRLLLVR